MRDFERNY